ncbi:MAG: D-alanyl-D-alanine carboxypeptidase [Nevskiaceae bacterium]|nr:MAG: D-alanyl-D-alanine carboxypeptidase [Nevskiaceae bacterium]TAM21998.1 MAG: D-alanyl-D-alanine carboxypeptidase [Nevskiaceae bacterium]
MKRFLLALAAATVLNTAQAAIPDPPALQAASWALLDFQSGELLAQSNSDSRVEPASITKVLTTYIVFDEIKKGRIKLDDMAFISEKAWRQGIDSSESRMFLNVGSRVRVEDLLHGVITQSGNDASVALAEHVAGGEGAFADLMNQYAAKLGMKNSHFMNAPGMPDPEHYTTAHDVTLLGRALIHDFPDYYKWFSLPDFTYNGIKQGNRNILLTMDRSVDGIKTGHTNAAGYCLLSSASRDGRRLVAAVMGTESQKYRAEASLELLNWGFRFFESVKLLGADQPSGSVRVWKGLVNDVQVGTLEPIYLSLPRGAAEKVEAQPQVDGTLIAPLSQGQHIGTVNISVDGKLVKSQPLVVLQAVAAGSWWKRLIDTIRLWFA